MPPPSQRSAVQAVQAQHSAHLERGSSLYADLDHTPRSTAGSRGSNALPLATPAAATPCDQTMIEDDEMAAIYGLSHPSPRVERLGALAVSREASRPHAANPAPPEPTGHFLKRPSGTSTLAPLTARPQAGASALAPPTARLPPTAPAAVNGARPMAPAAAVAPAATPPAAPAAAVPAMPDLVKLLRDPQKLQALLGNPQWRAAFANNPAFRAVLQKASGGAAAAPKP